MKLYETPPIIAPLEAWLDYLSGLNLAEDAEEIARVKRIIALRVEKKDV